MKPPLQVYSLLETKHHLCIHERNAARFSYMAANPKSLCPKRQRRPSPLYYHVLQIQAHYGVISKSIRTFLSPVTNTRSCRDISRELGGLFANDSQELLCLSMYFLNAPSCSESRRSPSEFIMSAAPRSLLQEKLKP